MIAVAVSNTIRCLLIHATPASPLGPSYEAVDVPRAGAKKMEEIDVLKSTRLAEAKQDQGIAKTLLRGRPLNHAPKRSESLNSVLCIVVIPGDVVEIQERKHFVAVLLQATDKLAHGFASTKLAVKALVEPIDSGSVLS